MDNKRCNRMRVMGCVFAFAVGMAGEAGAACVQTDLTGTWYAIGTLGNFNRDGFEGYIRCKIVLNSTGNIVASKSSCRGRDSVGSYTAAMTGGRVRVGTTCAITGNLVYDAGATNLQQIIELGQLARDKNIFTFTTYQSSNHAILGLFSAVKQ